MIWDLTTLDTTQLLESDLQRIAHFMRGQNMVDSYSIKIAMIAPTKATYGLASTYLDLILDDRTHISIFRSRPAAIQWLKTQKDSLGAQANDSKNQII